MLSPPVQFINVENLEMWSFCIDLCLKPCSKTQADTTSTYIPDRAQSSNDGGEDPALPHSAAPAPAARVLPVMLKDVYPRVPDKLTERVHG